ncbi:MAG: hypothetical protein OXF39_02895 [Nitrospira sp.]|nr:hypothetical protein [Nitrospira sp.]
MNFTAKDIALLSDTEFFAAKATLSPKIRRLLEQIHESFQRELTAHRLLAPDDFDPGACQFVKGEHLEDFPYQYLDYPRFFTRDVKFSFRSLVWWGHYMVFALIVEGGHLRRYKENLINRFPSVADRDIRLCLSHSLWEWKQGPGYTLEITRGRSSEVAAVLAHRPFFKLARFVPFSDPAIRSGESHHLAHQTLLAVLPVITE